jgi:hypothetical protein
MSIDERRWISCSGCSGEVGFPLDWKEETVRCPKCGTDLLISRPHPDVRWRPSSAGELKSDRRAVVPSTQLSPTVADPRTPQSPPAAQPRQSKSVVPTEVGRNNEPITQAEQSANGFAITGLSLGIAAVFLYFIGIIPILAIIFSGLGLAKVKSRQGRGQVQAWIGLILGILYTLMYMSMYGHL